MIRIMAVLAVAFVFVTSAQTAEPGKEGPEKLEQKFHGRWKGPACGGDWIFAEDGTYEVEHYSPGNNRASGTWQIQWNALPPTLVLTCKTSDAPGRIKIGGKSEFRVIQLDDESLVYQHSDQYPDGHKVRFERMKKQSEG